MVVKTLNLAITTTEVDYLQRVAKQRGISRTRLMQLMIEKILRKHLVEELVTTEEVAAVPRHQPYYRRFPLK